MNRGSQLLSRPLKGGTAGDSEQGLTAKRVASAPVEQVQRWLDSSPDGLSKIGRAHV
jgi:hypothetical protein